jgi:hypothetical protein
MFGGCIQSFTGIHLISKYPGMTGFYPAAYFFVQENALHGAKVTSMSYL